MDVQDIKSLPIMFGLIKNSVFKTHSYFGSDQHVFKDEQSATMFLMKLLDLK
jgi:hypothetical protein